MRITIYFKSIEKHINIKIHCYINVKTHNYTNDNNVIEQKIRNWKFIVRFIINIQKIQNSINQNAKRFFILFEVNQSKCFKFKIFINYLKSVYFCRRCKQRFILKNLFYKHLRHCFSNIKKWLFVNNFIEKFNMQFFVFRFT